MTPRGRHPAASRLLRAKKSNRSVARQVVSTRGECYAKQCLLAKEHSLALAKCSQATEYLKSGLKNAKREKYQINSGPSSGLDRPVLKPWTVQGTTL